MIAREREMVERELEMRVCVCVCGQVLRKKGAREVKRERGRGGYGKKR